MRRSRLTAAVLSLATIAGAARAAADDSVFGIRGLGFLGRPISARTAGTGGAFGLFDPATALNPASLSRWRTMVGWAVGVPSRRSFTSGGTTTALGSTRFPLIGFATVPGSRLTMGFTIGDYLDRTWGITRDTTILLRGDTVRVTDVKSSLGGVSDLRLAGAYQLTPRIAIGVGLHALTGSARSAVLRTFNDTNYSSFGDLAVTTFSGVGISGGVTAALLPQVIVSGVLRLNGTMTARKTTGERARVPLPTEAGFGVLVQPVPGVALGASAQYAGWSSAADALAASGEERSRNVWAFSVGGEFDTFRRGQSRLPLRFGYRTRQLPFPVSGALIGEHAVSGGFALDLAGAHTTVDLGFERGSRSVGGETERFSTGYLGVIIRP